MNRINRYLLVIAFAATMSSCGLYTKYERETVIESNLYGDLDTPAPASGVVNEGELMGNLPWREVFTDPTLQKLIESGLESNRDLQKSLMVVEQAQATLRTKRLAFLPQLSTAGGGYSVIYNKDLSGGVDNPVVSLTPSWVIDVFGSLRNDKERQKMLTEQSESTVQAIRAQVVASIANLYYTLQMLDAQIEITTATQTSWNESLRAAHSMMDAGLMNQAGVAQIESGQLGVESALRELRISRNEAQNTLCSLLAIAPQSIKVAELAPFTAPQSIQVGVPATSLSQRPDVKSAEAALAAAFYSENLARSAFYPKFVFSYSGSMEMVDFVNPATWVNTIVGMVTMPIFNSGINRANLKIAKLNYESMRLDFEQTLLNAGIEVNNALIAMGEYAAQQAIVAKQVEALANAARSTQLLMDNGSVTYLEVLTANQTLYSSQLSQVTNQYNQYTTLASLYTALGGGRE